MTTPITPRSPCMDKLIVSTTPLISSPSPQVTLTQPEKKAIIENYTPDPPKNYGLWEVKILQLVYLPTSDSVNVDQSVTGDVSGSLATIRQQVAALSTQTIAALEEGCHQTIAYRIVGRVEIQEGYPTTHGTTFRATGYNPPLVDYKSILNRFDILGWLNQGISQIWIWGYHGDKVTLWESNMSSSYGNISNSDRNKDELPVGGKSYTVFNFNYGRGVAEALESIGHQIEAILFHLDKELFWLKFVGAANLDTGRLVAKNGVYRCGWMHYCPNSQKDYDWFNPRVVTSDIGDWRPDGGGATAQVSAATWSSLDDGGLAWKKAWFKALPRGGQWGLTNWWRFIGDWDNAMKEGMRLK